MLPMLFPMMDAYPGHDQNYALAHAVARRLLADLIAKKEVLAGQIEAKREQLRVLGDQLDATKPAVEAQLPILLKPVFKKLGLKPGSRNASIYDLHKTAQCMTIDLQDKIDHTLRRAEIPMPEPMKSKCVEWVKVRAEYDALEKQSSVLHNSFSARTKKIEDALYDLLMQRQADDFMARLPKKALAKLKAIASGTL